MTHSRVRRRFSAVWLICPRPNMQVQPSHHAEDIGARFGDPSALSVLISATGVPKYRIVGSIVRCMIRTYRSFTLLEIRILRRN